MGFAPTSEISDALSSSQVTRQSQWKQSPSRTKAISFSPDRAQRVHRAWERRAVSTSIEGKQRKIWKRYQKLTDPGFKTIIPDLEDSEVVSPKKVLKKVCVNREDAKSARNKRRQGVASTFDRRKSGLPHKLPQVESYATDYNVEQGTSLVVEGQPQGYLYPPEDPFLQNREVIEGMEDHILEAPKSERDSDDISCTQTTSANLANEIVHSSVRKSNNGLDCETLETPSLTLQETSNMTSALSKIDNVHIENVEATPHQVTNVQELKDATDLVSLAAQGPHMRLSTPTLQIDDDAVLGDLFYKQPQQVNAASKVSRASLPLVEPQVNGEKERSNIALINEESIAVDRNAKTLSLGINVTLPDALEDPNSRVLSPGNTYNYLQNFEPSRKRTSKGDTLIDIQIMTMPLDDEVEESVEDTCDSPDYQDANEDESFEESVGSNEDMEVIQEEYKDVDHRTRALDLAEKHGDDNTLDIDLTRPIETNEAATAEMINGCQPPNIDQECTGLVTPNMIPEPDETLDISFDVPHTRQFRQSPQRNRERLKSAHDDQSALYAQVQDQDEDCTPDMTESENPPASLIEEVTFTTRVQLNDDDTILRDFLSRSRASKAARIAKRSSDCNKRDSDVIKHALASPVKVLENKDTNSPLITRAQVEQTKEVPIPFLASIISSDEGLSKDKVDLEDESVDSQPVLINRKTRNQPRRTAKAGPPQQNLISLRRINVPESLSLRRTETQELATITRTNTRRNKGNAKPALIMLAMMKSGELADHENKMIGKLSENDKGVRWNERLTEYFDESKSSMRDGTDTSLELQENDEISATKSRGRRAGTLGSINGTPSKARNNDETVQALQATAMVESVGRENPVSKPRSRASKGRIPTMKRAKVSDDEEKENKPGGSRTNVKVPTATGEYDTSALGSRRMSMPRRGIAARK